MPNLSKPRQAEWAKLLPEPLSGGRQIMGSKTNKPSAPPRGVSPVMAAGGYVDSASVKSPKEDLLGFDNKLKRDEHLFRIRYSAQKDGRDAEQAVKDEVDRLKTMRSLFAGSPEEKAVGGPLKRGYTGNSKGGKIDPQEEAGLDKFVYHKGEYMVPANIVNAIGGKDAIEDLLYSKVKEKIAGTLSSGPDNSVMPLTTTGHKQSFASGGEIKDRPTDPVQSNVYKFPVSMALGGTLNPKTPSFDPAPTAPISAHTGLTAGIVDPGFSSPVTPAPTTPTVTPAPTTPTVTPAPTTPTVTPETTAQRVAQAASRGQDAQTSGTSSSAADAQIQSLSTPEARAAAQSAFNSTGDIAAAMRAGNTVVSASLGANQTAQQAQTDLTAGNAPDSTQSIVNETLQQFGTNLAQGRANLEMQLSSSGITGQQAQAALDQYDLQGRVSLGQQQATLANQTIQAKEQAMQQALNAGDFNTYAQLSQQIYGVQIDTSLLKDQAAQKELSDSMSTLNSLNTQLGSDFNTSSPGAAAALDELWKASGNTGPVDSSWAATTVQNIKNSSNPSYQAANAYTEDQVVTDFFNNQAGALANFTYGSDTGYAAFQKAFQATVATGGYTYDSATGTFDMQNNGSSDNLWTLIGNAESAYNANPNGTPAPGGTPQTPAIATSGTISNGANTVQYNGTIGNTGSSNPTEVANATGGQYAGYAYMNGKLITTQDGQGYTSFAGKTAAGQNVVSGADGSLYIVGVNGTTTAITADQWASYQKANPNINANTKNAVNEQLLSTATDAGGGSVSLVNDLKNTTSQFASATKYGTYYPSQVIDIANNIMSSLGSDVPTTYKIGTSGNTWNGNLQTLYQSLVSDNITRQNNISNNDQSRRNDGYTTLTNGINDLVSKLEAQGYDESYATTIVNAWLISGSPIDNSNTTPYVTSSSG